MSWIKLKRRLIYSGGLLCEREAQKGPKRNWAIFKLKSATFTQATIHMQVTHILNRIKFTYLAHILMSPMFLSVKTSPLNNLFK